MKEVRSQTYFFHYLAICNAKCQCEMYAQLGKACFDYFKDKLTAQELNDLFTICESR